MISLFFPVQCIDDESSALSIGQHPVKYLDQEQHVQQTLKVSDNLCRFYIFSVTRRSRSDVSDWGKPPRKCRHFYLGIAQIAIAPPPPHSTGHSGALYFQTNLSNFVKSPFWWW